MKSKMLYMPEISEKEFVEHIENDDFFRVYGNPILIRSKDREHDCVIMTVEYYERQQKLLKEMEERIVAMCEVTSIDQKNKT